MSEMIERVASAMFEADDDGSWKHGQLRYRLLARAAIEAMREPTDAMCDAADWQQQSEVNQYQRAIDAALGKVDA